MNPDEIESLVKSVSYWNHTIKLGHIATPGLSSLEYQNFKSQAIPQNLEDKTVLDIGSNNGYFSFLCEERGAKRVVAIDDMVQSPPDILRGFEIAKQILRSKAEFKKLSVYEVEKLQEQFDITLFLDVYYHLEDPIGAFRKVASVTRELMAFAGLATLDDRPVAYLLRPCELHKDDASNCWVASLKCLERMFARAGFSNWRMLGTIPEEAHPVPNASTVRVSYAVYK
jgi:2-polyprenyl-3-methyl-5-hydroxy-6-metoxy-1,4-benzoquinol methylase